MDCQELIDLFNKVGGILHCDYDKKKIVVKNTNLECDIKPSNYNIISRTLYEFGFSPYEVSHIKKAMKHDEICKSNIKLVNSYLNNDESGFEIKFLSK